MGREDESETRLGFRADPAGPGCHQPAGKTAKYYHLCHMAVMAATHSLFVQLIMDPFRNCDAPLSSDFENILENIQNGTSQNVCYTHTLKSVWEKIYLQLQFYESIFLRQFSMKLLGLPTTKHFFI